MTSAQRVRRASRNSERRLTLAAIAFTAALAMTGCSGTEDPKASDHKTSSPAESKPSTSKPADPDAVEKAALKELYSKFWDAQAAAYAKGSSTGTDLKKYATGNALVRAESDLLGLRDEGIVAQGAPNNSVSAMSVELNRKVPRGQFIDCLDTSGWKFIYKKTGKKVPLPKNQLVRYEAKVKAEKWGKQWMILEVTPQDRAC